MQSLSVPVQPQPSLALITGRYERPHEGGDFAIWATVTAYLEHIPRISLHHR